MCCWWRGGEEGGKVEVEVEHEREMWTINLIEYDENKQANLL